VLTWASLSAYGFDLAPFFLCAFSFAGVALCGVPLPSSFLQPDATPHHGGDGPAVVVERTESQILVWYLLLAPCVLHVALHYSVLFEPGLGNVATTFALLALPVLLLRGLSRQNILWCLGGSAEQRNTAMNAAAAVAGAVLLYIIEMKIIFVNFAHYILLPEPMATAAVTLGLYGGVGTLFCVLTGALRNPVALSAIASTAGLAVSLALGMPVVLLWAPLVRFHSGSPPRSAPSVRPHPLRACVPLRVCAWMVRVYGRSQRLASCGSTRRNALVPILPSLRGCSAASRGSPTTSSGAPACPPTHIYAFTRALRARLALASLDREYSSQRPPRADTQTDSRGICTWA
jgi:hypothetical protein